MNKLIVVVTVLAVIALAAGCGGSSGKRSQASPQQQAVESAREYLSMGDGFSRSGLIHQLSSSAGEGFAKAVAISAVDHVKVNWNKQAAEDLKVILSGVAGLSRAQRIQLLRDDGFTRAQAVFAVNHRRSAPAITGTGPTANPHSESATCDLSTATDRSNCQLAYTACSVDAPKNVQRYYNGDGPNLDTIATRYAHSIWGSSGFAWQAGYAGCLGALFAEYDREHH